MSLVIPSLEANSVVPVGSTIPFAGSSAPTGWLICDGAEISRTTYAELFAVIGTAFGSGDGITTFVLPDLRGKFVRGVDGGTGNDPDAGTRTAQSSGGNTGNNVGSVQGDAFQGHWHEERVGGNNVNANGGNVGNSYRAGRDGSGTNINTSNDTQFNNVSTQDPISDGVNGTPRTSSETRPINVYLNYIIRY